MDPNMRECRVGMTYAEWLEDKLQILRNDAVSFFEVFTAAEDFGLRGQARDTFVVEVIATLIRAGAHPVDAAGPGTDWSVASTKYGTEPHEIGANVLEAHLASGKAADLGGVWFFAN